MSKGFGRADKVIQQQLVRSTLRGMPEEMQAESRAMADPSNLSEMDWEYLAMDFALMCSVYVEHHLPQFEGCGSRYVREDDGTVTGLTFLKHRDTDENVGLVLKQTAAGTPEYHCVEVFTTQASGVSTVPDKDLDRAGGVAERTLNQAALAYSFAYNGRKTGVLAGYGFTEGHVAEQVEAVTPEGCVPVLPITASRHPTTTQAITFAYALNKRAGVLFDGRPYSELGAVVGE
jgi:hypothetical protein